MEPYRDSFSACPRCNAPLRAFRERLVCDACEGLMVSIEDLRESIRELTSLEAVFSYRDEAAGKRMCPRCHSAMATAKLTIEFDGERAAKPGPELDRCAEHGLWFDESELAEVLESIAGKGFGGGLPHGNARGRTADVEPRPFTFRLGGRGWGM